MKKIFLFISIVAVIAVGTVIFLQFQSFFSTQNNPSLKEGKVIISEVAWMGSTNHSSHEWIELYNTGETEIDLTGWQLNAQDGRPSIALSGTIAPKGYFLLEQESDNAVSEIPADLIYQGMLKNSGEVLELINPEGEVVETIDAWYAGESKQRATMARSNFSDAQNPENWYTETQSYSAGYGSPKAPNSQYSIASNSNTSNQQNNKTTKPSAMPDHCTEHLNYMHEYEGAINVYFNQNALTEYALPGNETNYNINLEKRLIYRLSQAQESIDFATYEINLADIVDTLIQKASEGVLVRAIVDAKVPDDPHYLERFQLVRLYVEKMVRGRDGVPNTEDDVIVFSDSPFFAVEDKEKRESFDLPPAATDFPYKTYKISKKNHGGYLLAEAEQRKPGEYYSPRTQMHNKFAIIDNKWVFTGSWNFTTTGLYGDEENRQKGCMHGNQQHVIEVHSPELAQIYTTEFNEMWGSPNRYPDIENAKFNTRKEDNTRHQLTIDGRKVEIYFSPGDEAIPHMVELVKNYADQRVFFSIFAWSDQALVNELKFKWEGSYDDLQGSLTGFEIKGLFDRSFWNQWWSASVDMTGRVAKKQSDNNLNIRWNNPAPVFKANVRRKLHSKTMLIDPNTNSDPIVLIGSTNWSINGNDKNDENMLIIYDKAIVNQFVQEFYARYKASGGKIPSVKEELENLK